MTIMKAFENMLEEINTQLGADMCDNATQDGNHFTYDFDGYICCDLVIEPNGVVFESVDEGPSQRYESVLDWAQNIINQMNTRVIGLEQRQRWRCSELQSSSAGVEPMTYKVQARDHNGRWCNTSFPLFNTREDAVEAAKSLDEDHILTSSVRIVEVQS